MNDGSSEMREEDQEMRFFSESSQLSSLSKSLHCFCFSRKILVGDNEGSEGVNHFANDSKYNLKIN